MSLNIRILFPGVPLQPSDPIDHLLWKQPELPIVAHLVILLRAEPRSRLADRPLKLLESDSSNNAFTGLSGAKLC